VKDSVVEKSLTKKKGQTDREKKMGEKKIFAL
jgi:hypothetical protein